MSKPKILYVEDHYESAVLVQTVLKELYDVDFTEDYDKTIEYLETNDVDLILLDINLPGEKNGVEVLNTLRKNERLKRIPVIALTAYAMVGDRERLLKVGCDEYIPKPMNRLELITKIKKFLDSGSETEN